jgi:uncharacterized protein (UPF0371 family)
VNIAYEAATVDPKDEVLMDEYHLKAYDAEAVNYNRDIEAFHLLKRILKKITGGESMYQSPTDMGVNRAGSGIVNDTIITEAAHQEIVRRYLRCAVEYRLRLVDRETLDQAVKIMNKVHARVDDRRVVMPARKAARDAEKSGKGNAGVYCGAAIELHDGTIIKGKNSPLMHAASCLLLKATTHLARLPDSLLSLPKNLIESVTCLKKDILNGKMLSLDVDETLILLGISALTNPAAQTALEMLKLLRDCEVHLTHIPTPGDEAGLRKLNVNVTCDPEYSSKSLFVS